MCHHFQHEGEPRQHTERYRQKRAHGKHPGESLCSFGEHFGEHAASALQVNQTLKKRCLLENCVYTATGRCAHAQECVTVDWEETAPKNSLLKSCKM